MSGSFRILTIEDEPEIRNSIVAYLEDSGFVMLQAADGESGLQIFREQKPDAVLCDLRLPGMDGLSVLSAISDESPETPVIVVSGMDLMDFAVQSLKRGAWDYLVKPLHDMGVMENALHRALERAGLMRRNREYQQQLESVNRELSGALSRLQADEEAGRHIQAQLLPPDNRRIGDYRFRRRLYPSMYLSGDFLDYFPINDHYLGFYIADVSGHDAAAAFVTVMLKMRMSQYLEYYKDSADTSILSPAQTLTELNHYLYEQQLGKYLTIFYGVIDLRGNTLRYGQGGHYPDPILHDGIDAKPVITSRRNRPVGLFEGVRYTEEEMRLPEDFVLICASDGLLELLPGDSLEEKGRGLLSRVDSVAAGIENVVFGLDLEIQTHLPDDVTLLEIRRDATDG